MKFHQNQASGSWITRCHINIDTIKIDWSADYLILEKDLEPYEKQTVLKQIIFKTEPTSRQYFLVNQFL